jgi:hypothetical protein
MEQHFTIVAKVKKKIRANIFFSLLFPFHGFEKLLPVMKVVAVV